MAHHHRYRRRRTPDPMRHVKRYIGEGYYIDVENGVAVIREPARGRTIQCAEDFVTAIRYGKLKIDPSARTAETWDVT